MAHGHVVVMRRTGAEGSSFPVVTSSCMIGRHSDSDVRVQLPSVSRQHCRIDIKPDGQAWLVALAVGNPPLVNGAPVQAPAAVALSHGDTFAVADRQFRWRYPDGSPLQTSFSDTEHMTSVRDVDMEEIVKRTETKQAAGDAKTPEVCSQQPLQDASVTSSVVAARRSPLRPSAEQRRALAASPAAAADRRQKENVPAPARPADEPGAGAGTTPAEGKESAGGGGQRLWLAVGLGAALVVAVAVLARKSRSHVIQMHMDAA